MFVLCDNRGFPLERNETITKTHKLCGLVRIAHINEICMHFQYDCPKILFCPPSRRKSRVSSKVQLLMVIFLIQIKEKIVIDNFSF